MAIDYGKKIEVVTGKYIRHARFVCWDNSRAIIAVPSALGATDWFLDWVDLASGALVNHSGTVYNVPPKTIAVERWAIYDRFGVFVSSRDTKAAADAYATARANTLNKGMGHVVCLKGEYEVVEDAR